MPNNTLRGYAFTSCRPCAPFRGTLFTDHRNYSTGVRLKIENIKPSAFVRGGRGWFDHSDEKGNASWRHRTSLADVGDALGLRLHIAK